MTKKQSAVVACATLLVGLFLYQNCGPQKAVEFTGTETQNDSHDDDSNGNDFPSDPNKMSTSETQNFTIIQGANLTLTANAGSYAAFSDGACLWSFTDANKSVQTFQNPSNSITIQNIQSMQTGAYRLVCENSTRIHTFNFNVSVLVGGTAPSPTPGPTPAPVVERREGVFTYNGKRETASGFKNPYPNATRAEAEAECQRAIAYVKRKGGSASRCRCTWGSEQIYPK